MIDHDRLFKELLSTFFIEFVDLFLPDVSRYIDRDSIVFLDKEIFTDVTSGERLEADLVVRARFRGRESYFLIHVEHQARAEGEFGRRLFRYFARLYDKHELPVYPVVIFSYDAPKRAEPESHRVEFPGKVVLEFNYDVIQLNRLNWRDYIRHPNPVASALMSKMAMKPDERPRVKLECLRLLATLKLDRARMQLISGFIDTYLKLTESEMSRFQSEVKDVRGKEQKRVMQIVTSWMEEGIQQGLIQGQQKEALKMVVRLLNHRVGKIDTATRVRIKALELSELENLGVALLDFSRTEDLKRWLDKSEKRRAAKSSSKKQSTATKKRG